MWPFSHKKEASPAVPGEILERLDRLEHQIKLLKVEWAEVYDKIAHQFDRERKRREKALDPVQTSEGAAGPRSAAAAGSWEDPIFIMQQARMKGL